MNVLTFGCSYSEVPSITEETKSGWTWPVFLDKSLNGTVEDTENHQGSGASGNELISRKVIYYVNEALKSHKAEDLLVGIVWSGCDRHTLVLQESERQFNKTNRIPIYFQDQVTSYQELLSTYFHAEQGPPQLQRNYWLDRKQHYNNPQRLATKEFNHIILNNHWDDPLTVAYYEHFVDPLSSVLKTCENILKTQWFLKNNNIKYFMCAYDMDTFIYHGCPAYKKDLYTNDCPALSLQAQGDRDKEMPNYLEHPDVKYLYDMIDKDHWLPVDSLGEWCKHVSEFDFPSSTDPHPGWEQHQDFVNKVILPFLMQKYNISCYNA